MSPARKIVGKSKKKTGVGMKLDDKSHLVASLYGVGHAEQDATSLP